VFALNPPREELYARINARTEQHFANGLVDEVRKLLAAGVPANSNALGAHGYRRVVEFLRGNAIWTARSIRQSLTCAITPSGNSPGFAANLVSTGLTASATIRKRSKRCYLACARTR
jgi:hypothetical protein